MDWILKNKEWLFSGIGIAVIMAIIAIIRLVVTRRRVPQKRPSSNQTTDDPEQIQIPSSPKPKPSLLGKTLPEIFEDIKSHPPFQRDDVKRHYIGARIRFEGCLITLNKQESDAVFVGIGGKNDTFPAVRFVVNVTDYPQLKFIKEHDAITVVGKIGKLGFVPPMVELEDVEIEQL